MSRSRASDAPAATQVAGKASVDRERRAETIGPADAPPPVDDALADPTLIEWMLDRSPEQRLEALQGFVDSLWELRGGSKA